jgi:hypothetical protein
VRPLFTGAAVSPPESWSPRSGHRRRRRDTGDVSDRASGTDAISVPASGVGSAASSQPGTPPTVHSSGAGQLVVVLTFSRTGRRNLKRRSHDATACGTSLVAPTGRDARTTAR